MRRRCQASVFGACARAAVFRWPKWRARRACRWDFSVHSNADRCVLRSLLCGASPAFIAPTFFRFLKPPKKIRAWCARRNAKFWKPLRACVWNCLPGATPPWSHIYFACNRVAEAANLTRTKVRNFCTCFAVILKSGSTAASTIVSSPVTVYILRAPRRIAGKIQGAAKRGCCGSIRHQHFNFRGDETVDDSALHPLRNSDSFRFFLGRRSRHSAVLQRREERCGHRGASRPRLHHGFQAALGAGAGDSRG